MPHLRLLARGALLLSALVALLAPPWAFVSAPQASGGGAVALPVSLTAVTGSSTEYAGAAKIARLQAPPQQAATNIVISEIAFSGPDGEGDEFIELYNPTSADIPIAGWSLWKTAGCLGAISSVHTFGLGAAVKAWGHYLVGSANFSGQADVEAEADIGISTTANGQGGIALVQGSAYDANNIIDQVGTEQCPASPYFHEGTSLAPLLDAVDQSYDRNAEAPDGICRDSNNNAADFFRRIPSDPQNSLDPLTRCGNPTSTPTATSTSTATSTPTATSTLSCTSEPDTRVVLINEVAWSGTTAAAADVWIELYNPSSGCAIRLEDWRLVGTRGTREDFDLRFDEDDIVPRNGFLLIAHEREVFGANVTATVREFNIELDTRGAVLQLLGPDGELVDTANFSTTGTASWPAGTTTSRRSMERYRNAPDTRTNWLTFARTPLPSDWPRARGGNLAINGSPGRANWASSVTPTAVPEPTKRRTPTPRPPTPFARVVINEFLPRAGTDWNQDGAVDVFDEFIELKNLGPIDVDLSGWKLDDEDGLGSPMFTLPSVKLKPGERTVFYGLRTRILLEDSGGTVRLINPRGIIFDARGYGVVERLNNSHCRLPDGYYWRLGCFPTPGNENSLTGIAPQPVPRPLGIRPPCLLPDIVPEPFRQAECDAFGNDIWDPAFWDDPFGSTIFIVPSLHIKWTTSVE